MKPYVREKKVMLNLPDRHPKKGWKNWWEDMCDYLSRSTMKQKVKKELKKIEVKTLNANKVIEWLKNTIKERAENYGVYKATRLILPPYNSIEDLINDFKKDFGL